MTMNEKDLVKKVITKILGITSDELDALIYQKADGEDEATLITNASELILNKNADKVQGFKDKNQEFFDNGHAKAKLEVLSKIEKEFKEATNYTSDKQGVELFTGYADSVKGSAPDEPTEDQIKKSTTYVQMEQLKEKEKTEAVEAVTNELTDFKTGIEHSKTQGKFKGKAWDRVWGQKPNVEKETLDTRKNAFLNEFNQYGFSENGNNTIVITKDEKRVEDSQGNALTLDQLVDSISARHFTFQKQDDKGSAGNNGGEGGTGGGDIVIDSKEKFFELGKLYEGNQEMMAKLSIEWNKVKDKF